MSRAAPASSSGPPGLNGEALFNAEFLEQVARLRIVARRVPPRGRWAEQRSPQRGSGLEFRDYRGYTAGDELRAIDWNIYRRLGKVFVRLFEELEDLPLYLMPDQSRSVWFEADPRGRAGLRTALGLAAIGLSQHDTVGVFPFDDTVHIARRPTSGRDRILVLARHFEQLAAEAAAADRRRTDLAAALTRIGALGLRPGLLAVISDFFDPNGLDAVIDALKRSRHRLLLVTLVRASDREPDLIGDVRLRDCEGAATLDVSVTNAVRERYRAAYDRFHATLADFAKKRGAGLLQLDVERPVVPQLATLFEGGRLTV